MAKLANISSEPSSQKLTRLIYSPFIVSFKYPLEKGFTFCDMEKTDMDVFQAFLDRVCGRTFQDVDSQYKRTTDHNDSFHDQDVIHYGLSNGFRLHGIIENGRFKVIRIDPNHRVHN